MTFRQELTEGADRRDRTASAVATVIPTYNPGTYLHETLRSLERQTSPPAEVVVVDDGSDVPVELPDFALPIRMIRTHHGGISSARNAGVLATSSPLVHILDHDDVIDPCFYEVLLGAFGESPTIDVLHTLTGSIDAHGAHLEGQFPSSIPDYRDGSVARRLLEENWLGSVATVFRREVYDSVGGFRPFHFVQDWDFWIRAALDGWRFEVVPEVLAWHREHPGKQVKLDNLEAMHRDSMEMRRRLRLPARLQWWRARTAAADRLRLAQIRIRRGGRTGSALADIALALPLRPLGSLRSVLRLLTSGLRHAEQSDGPGEGDQGEVAAS